MKPISINLYRLDPGESGRPAPAFTSRAAIAAADLSTTVHVMAVGEALCLSTDDVERMAVSRQLSAVGQIPRESIAANSGILQVEADEPPLGVHQPMVDKRPLSSFAAERHGPAPLGAKPTPRERSGGALEPATTVAAFRWPRVCQELSKQHGDPIRAAADAMLAQASRAHSLVCVVSLYAGQGCTTTLLCLARELAGRGKRLIVVDANFASPGLASGLGIEPATAWQDILERGMPVGRAIVHSKTDRFDLLPLDGRPTSGPQLAAGLQPAITAGVLLDHYDLVLVDLGAMLDPLAQATSLELVRNMRMDSAVAVTGPGPADSRELGLVGQLLAQRGCELLGTIENRVPVLPRTAW